MDDQVQIVDCGFPRFGVDEVNRCGTGPVLFDDFGTFIFDVVKPWMAGSGLSIIRYGVAS